MTERIRKAKDEGFTLIELLIVIIILGILAAIVVFAVGSTRGDSVTSTCKTDVKSIILAEEGFKTQNGSYTVTKSDLTLLKAWPGGTDASADDLVFTLGGTTDTPTITLTGKGLKTQSGVVNLTDTDTAIGTACQGK